jgi:hypothetical protein
MLALVLDDQQTPVVQFAHEIPPTNGLPQARGGSENAQ